MQSGFKARSILHIISILKQVTNKKTGRGQVHTFDRFISFFLFVYVKGVDLALYFLPARLVASALPCFLPFGECNC